MYVTGGRIKGTQTNRAEVIDVDGQAGTVSTLPPMQETREEHALAAAGSLLFAFGGWIDYGSYLSSCEFYDSLKNRLFKNLNGE